MSLVGEENMRWVIAMFATLATSCHPAPSGAEIPADLPRLSPSSTVVSANVAVPSPSVVQGDTLFARRYDRVRILRPFSHVARLMIGWSSEDSTVVIDKLTALDQNSSLNSTEFSAAKGQCANPGNTYFDYAAVRKICENSIDPTLVILSPGAFWGGEDTDIPANFRFVECDKLLRKAGWVFDTEQIYEGAKAHIRAPSTRLIYRHSRFKAAIIIDLPYHADRNDAPVYSIAMLK
jgi:hypothetical protein